MCKTVYLGSVSTAHSNPVYVSLLEERGGTWEGRGEACAPQFQNGDW